MPFAGYKDFADCVAKNRDKRDPEAYCAAIKQRAEDDEYEQAKQERVGGQASAGRRAEPETPPRSNQHTGWWKGHL